MKTAARSLAVAALLATLFTPPASPWAWRGHEVIDAAAVDGLPADGPGFLKKQRDYILKSVHDIVNANGWKLPNPNGYSTKGTIHEDFENVLVNNMKLSEKNLLTRMPPPGHLEGDVFDNILAFLDKSGARQEDIYKLDKAGVLMDASNAQSREMVYVCATDGATTLRDLIYRAWLESGQPNPNTDKSPVSPNNPLYNPETGSAPATRSPQILNLPKGGK